MTYVESSEFDIPDDTGFINENHIGNHPKTKIGAQQILGIHHRRKLDAGLFYIWPCRLAALKIYGCRKDLHVVLMRVIYVLPARQLLPAGSPGGPHIDDILLIPAITKIKKSPIKRR